MENQMALTNAQNQQNPMGHQLMNQQQNSPHLSNATLPGQQNLFMNNPNQQSTNQQNPNQQIPNQQNSNQQNPIQQNTAIRPSMNQQIPVTTTSATNNAPTNNSYGLMANTAGQTLGSLFSTTTPVDTP